MAKAPGRGKGRGGVAHDPPPGWRPDGEEAAALQSTKSAVRWSTRRWDRVRGQVGKYELSRGHPMRALCVGGRKKPTKYLCVSGRKFWKTNWSCWDGHCAGGVGGFGGDFALSTNESEWAARGREVTKITHRGPPRTTNRPAPCPCFGASGRGPGAWVSGKSTAGNRVRGGAAVVGALRAPDDSHPTPHVG